jgi:hypothetical protein
VTGGAAKSGAGGTPDHAPSQVTALPTSPHLADATSSSSGSAFKKEYVAAGVFATLLAWLLLRRRRRS